MDRNTERGQMMIEMLVLVLVFTGLFLVAIGLTENGEDADQRHRFPIPGHFSSSHARGRP